LKPYFNIKEKTPHLAEFFLEATKLGSLLAGRLSFLGSLLLRRLLSFLCHCVFFRRGGKIIVKVLRSKIFLEIFYLRLT